MYKNKLKEIQSKKKQLELQAQTEIAGYCDWEILKDWEHSLTWKDSYIKRIAQAALSTEARKRGLKLQ